MRGNTHEEVVEALRFLFGGADLGMPAKITKVMLKQAYRERVFECHPDRAKSLGTIEPKLVAHTVTLNGAYALLSRLIAKGDIESRKYIRPNRSLGAGASAAKKNAPKRTAPIKPGLCSIARQRITPRPEEYAYRVVMTPFWEGPLPSRELRFGRYLYYKGIISWDTLVEGLMWQAAQRPVLGTVLISGGYIAREELQEILNHRRQGEFIGACALRRGYITPSQLDRALAQQKKEHRALGTYFVRRGLMNYDCLRRYLKRHQAHNLNCELSAAGVSSLRARRQQEEKVAEVVSISSYSLPPEIA